MLRNGLKFSLSRFHDNQGFTLLELMIVMAIIGMAAALVIPRMSTGQLTYLKAQVREAVAVLTYARRSAIIHGKPSVALFFDDKHPAPSPNAKTEPGRWVSRGATLEWGEEVDDKQKAVYQITFYPEGGSSGGELILNHHGYKAKIKINSLTGKIESEILENQLPT